MTTAPDETDWSQVTETGRAILPHNCYSNSRCLIQVGQDPVQDVCCRRRDPVRVRDDSVTKSMQNMEIVCGTGVVTRCVVKASDVSPTPSDADGELRDLNLIALKMLGIHDYDKATFDHPRLKNDTKLHACVAME